jgi:hypothetical protein
MIDAELERRQRKKDKAQAELNKGATSEDRARHADRAKEDTEKRNARNATTEALEAEAAKRRFDYLMNSAGGDLFSKFMGHMQSPKKKGKKGKGGAAAQVTPCAVLFVVAPLIEFR